MPCGRGRVDRVHERAEEGAFRLQPLDHLQQMRQRPRQTVDAHHDQRVALADPLQHPRQHGPRAVPARGLLLVDLDAACGFQGLRLGQGGLILGRDARIADQGHQNRPFAVSYTTNKRPFVNECNGLLCGTFQQETLGFHTLSAIREISRAVPRQCYIKVRRRPIRKPLGKLQNRRILHI